MKMIDFRGIFQREWLPELFINNTDLYYEAIYEDGVGDLIKYVWDEMIKAYDKNPDNYPLEFTVNTYNHGDDTAFSVIQMPELAKSKGRNLAIYAMVVFDTNNKKKPRFFLGETDYNNLDRYIFTVEISIENEEYIRQNFGPLAYVNGHLKPVKREDELIEFIECVRSIYEEE